jgi:hypothetical protein
MLSAELKKYVDFIMKKIAIGGGTYTMKTMGIVLTLIFTMSLFAGGLFADTGCGAKCCDQTNPIGMHHTTDEQIESLMNCRSNIPQIPCDLQSNQVVELPEYALAAAGNYFPSTVGLTGVLSDSSIDNNVFNLNCFVQTVWEKSQPPPIYLQKQSFLI